MDDDILDKLTKMFEASQQATAKASKQQASLTKAQLKNAREITNMEIQSRERLSEKEIQAANERQARELASRLEITDKEIAAQMARLEKELGVRREEIANNLTIARERLGFDREKLAQEIGMERDRLALAREEMERIGIPKMLADKWYQEQQVALAQEAQKIDREKLGVDRGRLGFDVFSKAVELASSPATRYQFGDFAAGLANNANARDWLGAMASETAAAGFGAPVDAGVDPITPDQAMQQFLQFVGAGYGAMPSDPAQAANPDIQAGRQMHDLATFSLAGDGAKLGQFQANYQQSLAGGASHVQAVRDAYVAVGLNPNVLVTALPGGMFASLPAELQAVLTPGQPGMPQAPGAGAGAAPASGQSPASNRVNDQMAYAGGTANFNERTGLYEDGNVSWLPGVSPAPGATSPAPAPASGQSPAMKAFLDQQQRELAQIRQIADAGAGALAPGTLEALGEDKLAEFQSGLAKLRRDVPAWMRSYQLTRPYQGAPDQLAA